MKPGLRGLSMCFAPLLLLSSLLMAGCGALSPALEGSRGSADELARAVLDALQQRDLEALRGLALSEQEFREHVWPELPAARPERNLPFSYVWGDLFQKSESMLLRTIEAHGGRHYELVRIGFRGETTPYASYLVHRDGELTIKDEEGVERQLRVFGSVLEKDGRFKVFSYVVD